MKVHVWIILLFFSSIAYAEEDIRWKDADEKMQEQQYEEAAKLYKELSHKSDTVYEEINSRGVKDMRKTLLPGLKGIPSGWKNTGNGKQCLLLPVMW